MGRLFLAFIAALLITATASAETKRAFIVGVGDYAELPDLDKTLGDAEGYTGVFKEDLGFEVTHLKDPGHLEFLEAFDGFVKSIAPGDQIAFIFSGHGWSDGGDNYLAMTDAPQAASEFALSKQTVSLAGDIMGQIQARQPGLVFAVIDACRDNPFDTGTRNITRGLVRMEQVPGTLVVYAAGARQKALDNLGPEDDAKYSVFTRSLLPKLKDPKTPLMRAVEDAKNETTQLAQSINHRQRPATYSDVSIDYCFAGADCDTNVTVDIDAETADWVHISSAGYGTVHPCKKYQNYLDKWGEDGKFADTARANLGKHQCNSSKRISVELDRSAWTTNAIWHTELSPDGEKILVSEEGGTINVFDPRLIASLSNAINIPNTNAIFKAHFSNDTSKIVALDYTNKVAVYLLRSPLPLNETESVICDHGSKVFSAKFSKSGNKLVTGADDGSVKIWDVSKIKTLGELSGESECRNISTLRGHTDRVRSITYSPDENFILTASEDGLAILWKIGESAPFKILAGHSAGIWSTTFSLDGSYIATSSADKSAKIWAHPTGELLQTLEGHENDVMSVEFTPSADTVLTSSWDKTARIWNVATGSQIVRFDGHSDHVSSASFSPSGELVLTASDDKTARLWDSNTGELLFALTGNTSFVRGALFSPDEKFIVTSSADSRISVWRIDELQQE